MIERFELSQPDWALAELDKLPEYLVDVQDRMAAVIRFSQLNIEFETGGPFAAGVFETVSGRLVTIGVNRVVHHQCSSAHAEVMALSLAQQTLGSFDLGAQQIPEHQLVVNWRPCAMCYGALVWSGVRSLVVAGSGPELEKITGFDEGPIHPDWVGQLERRGIFVVDGIQTDAAIEVFKLFRDSGALVYNGRQGGSNA
ncbi:MAG: deaminase [Candidatus Azotimanducaceae bacterium WSBS_2022_MAG_OTU7]